MTENKDTPTLATLSWKILGWILDLIAVGVLAFVISVNVRVDKLELWQASTESNRYTNREHAVYATAHSREHVQMERERNALNVQWLKEVSQINTALAEIRIGLQNAQDYGWHQDNGNNK